MARHHLPPPTRRLVSIPCAAFICLAWTLAALCLPVSAQTPPAARSYDATNLRQPTQLAAGWLVQLGDDTAYAQPNFDDSHWFAFNASTDSLHILFPQARPNVVWYRLHLKVAPGQNDLALAEYYISSAFDLYANGVPILKVGNVAPFAPADYRARLLARIPPEQLATGSVVLALRVRLTSTEWTNAFPGYYFTNLILGQQSVLGDFVWLRIIGQGIFVWLNALAILCLMLCAFLLYSAQRRSPEYLFLALWGLTDVLTVPLSIYSEFRTFPAWWHILDSVATGVAPYLFARTYLAFVGRVTSTRMKLFLIFTGILSFIGTTMDWRGTSNLLLRFITSAPYVVLISVVLPVILIAQIRRGNREARILLLPLLLFGTFFYVNLGSLAVSQIPSLRDPAWHFYLFVQRASFGPFTVSLDIIVNILAILSLALIILLRSNNLSRRQAVMEGELAAAREVQQVILPEQVETIPGFLVESVYQPAQQVGGDFFQVLPDSRGGLLVVIGDVAGKGLPAAMLVSVIVGSIRTAANYGQNPSEILAQLNERLIGRSHGGFSTALAAHITADGWVTIASAGHLSPYLDGREVELPGALPLGIVSGAAYETTSLHLPTSSRLTFYSDGVVEAQNQQGELFGFDRARDISTQSAAAIANAAAAFGQSDDITVVAIRRVTAIANAA
jgi:phosphoserine phosphatase RsbU/P